MIEFTTFLLSATIIGFLVDSIVKKLDKSAKPVGYVDDPSQCAEAYVFDEKTNRCIPQNTYKRKGTLGSELPSKNEVTLTMSGLNVATIGQNPVRTAHKPETFSTKYREMVGKRWTDDEIAWYKTLIAEGFSLEEVSLSCGRSVDSIKERI